MEPNSTLTFKIGSDPEVFLYDKKSKKYIAPSTIGFTGTKEEPLPIMEEAITGLAVQVDGLALEFNIPETPYATSFSDAFYYMREWLNDELDKKSKKHKMNLEVHYEPVAEFEPEYFKEVVPADDKILGCSADYNMEGKKNKQPEFHDEPIRTAAGHIHIGWSEGEDCKEGSWHFKDCVTIAQTFAESGFFDPVTKREKKRLEMYGANGSFRPKSYGIELRSPSNNWIKDRESIEAMFCKVQREMKRIAAA